VRRYIYNQVGPAENATANPEQAENYNLPPTRSTANPSDIYELIDYIKDNEAYFSTEILNYLESNNIPNKSAQLDLLIVPENIYVTFVWDTVTLKVYDGWIGDQNCREYLTATATSSLIMGLYQNRGNMDVAKNLLLDAEANGELTYSFNRLNPTISEVVLWLQAVSTTFSIIGWILFLMPRIKKKSA